MNMSNDKEKLNELVAKAMQALSEAQDFAEKHNLEFSFEPAYGMGGSYTKLEEWQVEDWDDYSKDQIGKYRWFPSSQNC